MNAPAFAAVQPRAVGTARVVVRADQAGQTRIADLRMSGSLKLVFPQRFSRAAEAILVNTAGGITGGDRYAVEAQVDVGATLSITTQAAERAYRAQPHEIGRVSTTLTVNSQGRLNWLPQELILFDHAALQRRLDISLARDAQLLMVEPMVFGRAAMQEVLRDVRFEDRIRITQEGVPIFADGMDLFGDAATHLAKPTIANGAGAMATLVLVAPDAAAQLGPMRAMLPATAGASMLRDNVLVLRHLAADSFELRRHLVPILDRLTQNTLPQSWRL
ncbi:MAG: urease accessory protein UreD [Sulfitobacter sp.]